MLNIPRVIIFSFIVVFLSACGGSSGGQEVAEASSSISFKSVSQKGSCDAVSFLASVPKIVFAKLPEATVTIKGSASCGDNNTFTWFISEELSKVLLISRAFEYSDDLKVTPKKSGVFFIHLMVSDNDKNITHTVNVRLIVDELVYETNEDKPIKFILPGGGIEIECDIESKGECKKKLSFHIKTLPENGTLACVVAPKQKNIILSVDQRFAFVTEDAKSINADNVECTHLEYIPNDNVFGSDRFIFYAENSNRVKVSIDVKSINDKPIANAGEDKTVTEGELITLLGDKSSDVDDDKLNFEWTSSDVSFENNKNVTLRFNAPEVDSDRTITIKLTVTDSEGATSSDTVLITVTNTTLIEPPEDKPVADSYTCTINDNISYAIDLSKFFVNSEESGLQFFLIEPLNTSIFYFSTIQNSEFLSSGLLTAKPLFPPVISDSFQYKVKNGEGVESDPATITIIYKSE